MSIQSISAMMVLAVARTIIAEMLCGEMLYRLFPPVQLNLTETYQITNFDACILQRFRDSHLLHCHLQAVHPVLTLQVSHIHRPLDTFTAHNIDTAFFCDSKCIFRLWS